MNADLLIIGSSATRDRVQDASFMPSIAAVNSSLPLMTNALRVAVHLRARFSEGAAHG